MLHCCARERWELGLEIRAGTGGRSAPALHPLPPTSPGSPPGWAALLPNSLTTRHRVFGLTTATRWAESCCSGLSLACRQGAGHVRTLQSAAMQLQSQAAKGKQNAQNLPPPPRVIKISFL